MLVLSGTLQLVVILTATSITTGLPTDISETASSVTAGLPRDISETALNSRETDKTEKQIERSGSETH